MDVTFRTNEMVNNSKTLSLSAFLAINSICSPSSKLHCHGDFSVFWSILSKYLTRYFSDKIKLVL